MNKIEFEYYEDEKGLLYPKLETKVFFTCKKYKGCSQYIKNMISL